MNEFYKELGPFVGFSEEEAKLFVGKNSDYFLKKWKTSERPDKKAGNSSFIGVGIVFLMLLHIH